MITIIYDANVEQLERDINLYHNQFKLECVPESARYYEQLLYNCATEMIFRLQVAEEQKFCEDAMAHQDWAQTYNQIYQKYNSTPFMREYAAEHITG